MDNHRLQNDPETKAYLPENRREQLPESDKYFLLKVAACPACVLAGFIVGFIACWIVRPNFQIIERQKDANEEEVRQLANKKVKAMLQNCAGVLEVKDYEATTTRYKKAAVANKGGFTDIQKGVPYAVYGYSLVQNKETKTTVGYGIVTDSQGLLFQLRWQSSTTATPENIKSLTVSHGIKIDVSDKTP